ncbi:MAG: hypothetical protein ABR548_05890 [Actinomycetota bacterium]|nr:hypothetical protein [Actinomycetota bacterium]
MSRVARANSRLLTITVTVLLIAVVFAQSAGAWQTVDGGGGGGVGLSCSAAPAAPTWTQSLSSGPTAAWGSAMAFDPTTCQTVVFGGCLQLVTGKTATAAGKTIPFSYCSNASNATWTRADATGTWSGPFASSPSPGARYLASMFYDPNIGHVVLYGGTKHSVGSPDPTLGNNCQASASTPLISGGVVHYDACYGDTWWWDGVNRSWHLITQTGAVPGPRFHAALAGSNGTSGRAVLFSGCEKMGLNLYKEGPTYYWECEEYGEWPSQGGELGTVWTLGLTNNAGSISASWVKWPTGSCPSGTNVNIDDCNAPWPRRGAALVNMGNPAQGRYFLFGGWYYSALHYGGALADSWEFNANTGAWTRYETDGYASGAYLGGACLTPGAIKNPVNGSYYGFGVASGNICPGRLSSLGVAFVRPVAGVHDPFLFGGTPQCATASPCVDSQRTWIWQTDCDDVYAGYPNCWREVEPPVAPAARHAMGITYDGGVNGVVLFGGIATGQTAAIGDTWVFGSPSS